jgi:hypothetical protein
MIELQQEKNQVPGLNGALGRFVRVKFVVVYLTFRSSLLPFVPQPPPILAAAAVTTAAAATKLNPTAFYSC